MAYANRELTNEQRETLKPTFKEFEDAIDKLETALTAVRRRPGDDDDPGGGICGTGCGCSSFDEPDSHGPRKSMLDKCRRTFCGHTRLAHTT